MTFFPVIAIQGPRQVGKSAMIRDLLPRHHPSLRYTTFDQEAVLQFAKANPESFLQTNLLEQKTLAIDEAQKVPQIFDAVKYQVDQKRIPGQFILLGSTEFSKRTLIRESLTGRMCMLRLFPFTIGEAQQLPFDIKESALTIHSSPRITRAQFLKHLECGGMPGVFHVRDDGTRTIYFREWLEMTILRDLMTFPKIKLDPNLGRKILEAIATLEEPSIGHISKYLGVDARRVRKHVECLEGLFILHRIDPHGFGSGQPIYFLCDVGLAAFFGATFERRLHTWMIQELLANAQISSDVHEKLYYYRSLKGKILHAIVENREQITAIKILAKEGVTELDAKLLSAFRDTSAKKTKKPIRLVALGAMIRPFADKSIEVHPWEALA